MSRHSDIKKTPPPENLGSGYNETPDVKTDVFSWLKRECDE